MILSRHVGALLLAFYAVVLFANLPLRVGTAADTVAAMVMFASLAMATVGTVVHFRSNSDLRGSRRSVWLTLLCMPIIGVTAYYLRVMRAGDGDEHVRRRVEGRI